ncbi:MAG: DUF4142 domain-containing protein [Oceanicaulis sp.]
MADKHTGPMNMVDKAVDKIGGLFGKAKAGTASGADDFVENAAIGNRYELEAADIAMRRTQDARVREFAQAMKTDHEAAKAKLQDTLSTHPEAPDLPGSLDARRRSMLDHLEQAPDEEFDARYAEQQDLAHQETVKLFETYVEDGDNAGLQRFAKQMLPTLQQHLSQAKDLHEQTKH